MVIITFGLTRPPRPAPAPAPGPALRPPYTWVPRPHTQGQTHVNAPPPHPVRAHPNIPPNHPPAASSLPSTPPPLPAPPAPAASRIICGNIASNLQGLTLNPALAQLKHFGGTPGSTLILHEGQSQVPPHKRGSVSLYFCDFGNKTTYVVVINGTSAREAMPGYPPRARTWVAPPPCAPGMP